MSTWDWIHAGLEIATYAKARDTQNSVTQMQNAVERAAAERALLEAMRQFIFDVSRDIQLAAEQGSTYPQQAYIISRLLDERLKASELRPEMFPDFQDKEYVYNTQKKIADTLTGLRQRLDAGQIQTGEQAAQYLMDLPILQRAVEAKSAQEHLLETETEWKQKQSEKTKLDQRIGLGCFAYLFVPMIAFGIGGMLNSSAITGILTLAGWAAIFWFSKSLSTTVPGYDELNMARENWRKQLIPHQEWLGIAAKFGDVSSTQFKTMYDERITFLNPLLGGDFQKYLTA